MTVSGLTIVIAPSKGNQRFSGDTEFRCILHALIKEKTAAGWQFNFLGTGIDAYHTGARMGVAAMSTMSSGRSPQHVRASYAAMGESTAAYAAGRARDTHLSMSARAASGDAHFQRVFGQQGSEVPKPQSPPIPSQPKHKAVDDFSL